MKPGQDTSGKPKANSTDLKTTPDDLRHEYAIVDLGSNSFHLHVIRVLDGEWRHMDHHREVTKLVDGLLPDGIIEPSKREEVLLVLRRYGERITGFSSGNVRVIGTSAFRQLRRDSQLFRESEAALGFPIDIISGEEEARLIYLGIISEDAPQERKRFIIDIGGGSTEFIYGEGRSPVCIDSVALGNISLTRNVFEGRELTADLFKATVADVAEALCATKVYDCRESFEVVLGASGTMRLVASLIEQMELGSGGIELKPLKNLTKMFIKNKTNSFIRAGLPEERVASFPGALALLTGIMKTFELDRIRITKAGLRQGILHDMMMVPDGKDRRIATLTRLMDRHKVDRLQRDRVYDFAAAHLDEIRLDLPSSLCSPKRLLRWAADLHEIGLTINYSSYHKHGTYLIRHSDFPGFTREEQGHLAFLVLNHRKRIKLDRLKVEDAVPMPLLFLFRMAWALNRKRTSIEDPVRALRVVQSGFEAEFQPGWLHEHPLVARQLAREQERWLEVGYTLKLVNLRH